MITSQQFLRYLIRLAQQPGLELHRAAIYARHANRRDSFLDFQRSFVDRRLSPVRAMTPRFGVTEGNAGSGVAYELHGKLGDLLNKYGSDKATTHDYDVIYTNFANLSGVPVNMVEIGLGTTGARASSMGSGGSPGASARAFRDWGASVIGADIDRSILVNEPGIRSYFVDQLIPRTLSELVSVMGEPLDLVIIDGLHTPEADLNSLLALAPCLSRRGLLVVEDIENVPEITEIWRAVLWALPSIYRGALILTKVSAVLLLVRADNPFVYDWIDIYPRAGKPIATSGQCGE